MAQNKYHGEYGATVSAQTSNMALFSLIAGVLAWFILPFVGAIAAVILGHMGLGEIRNSGGTLGGRGMAVAGLVLGYGQLAVSILAIALIVVMVLFLTASGMETYEEGLTEQDMSKTVVPDLPEKPVRRDLEAPPASEEDVDEGVEEMDTEWEDEDEDGFREAQEAIRELEGAGVR